MTRDELTALFDRLTLRGNHVVVHTALSSFGTLEGGAPTVCAALVDAVGDAGTVLMPAFTYAETLGVSQLAGGSAAKGAGGRPLVAFHPDLPASREIGVVANAFRHFPGVLRSSHPTHSFAAWGRHARDVLSTQRDNNPLGPLKKLNVMQGQVLLLGTTLQAATAIHLAEEGAAVPYLGRHTAVRLNAAGYEERVIIENVPGCSNAFRKLEDRVDPSKVRTLALPHGTARKIPIRYLVTLAAKLLEDDPAVFVCNDPGCQSCRAKRDALTSVHPGD